MATRFIVSPQRDEETVDNNCNVSLTNVINDNNTPSIKGSEVTSLSTSNIESSVANNSDETSNHPISDEKISNNIFPIHNANEHEEHLDLIENSSKDTHDEKNQLGNSYDCDNEDSIKSNVTSSTPPTIAVDEGGNSGRNSSAMNEQETNQIVNNSQSEFTMLTVPNDDQSANKNDDEIDVEYGDNYLGSNNVDDVATEKNAIPENNDNDIPEAHQFCLPLNFDPTAKLR